MQSRPRKANIHRPKEWFTVLQTTRRSQTAMMTLQPGQSSGDEAEAHQGSDQVLLVVSGEVSAFIKGQRSTLRDGDVVVIPPGTKHRFTNRSGQPVVTFSVYSPPVYPAGEKG